MSAQTNDTPLDLARQHGHGTVVEVLMSKAMQIAELWAASRDGNTNRVLSLLDTCKQISVNTCDKDGQTALHILSKNGHTDTMVALLRRGADINARDKAELWVASRDGDTNRVLSLLDTCKGISVNAHDKTTYSFNDIINREEFILHYSTIHHAVAILGRFNKGALMSKLDLQAAFPMVPVLASKWELLGMHWHDNYYVDTCLPFSLLAPSILTTLPVPSTGCWNTWLPSCTTWPGPLSPDGQTALHISSKNGHTDNVVALLERGADINARDKMYMMYHTPLDLARRHGHGTVVEVLESKAMKEAELWAASRDGNTNRVLSLLDTCKLISVNAHDKSSACPPGTTGNKESLVEHLLQHEANFGPHQSRCNNTFPPTPRTTLILTMMKKLFVEHEHDDNQTSNQMKTFSHLV
ncbi:hypothetical protein EMCRGX_G017175 [Ephydatia muelleri]